MIIPSTCNLIINLNYDIWTNILDKLSLYTLLKHANSDTIITIFINRLKVISNDNKPKNESNESNNKFNDKSNDKSDDNYTKKMLIFEHFFISDWLDIGDKMWHVFTDNVANIISNDIENKLGENLSMLLKPNQSLLKLYVINELDKEKVVNILYQLTFKIMRHLIKDKAIYVLSYGIYIHEYLQYITTLYYEKEFKYTGCEKMEHIYREFLIELNSNMRDLVNYIYQIHNVSDKKIINGWVDNGYDFYYCSGIIEGLENLINVEDGIVFTHNVIKSYNSTIIAYYLDIGEILSTNPHIVNLYKHFNSTTNRKGYI